MRRIRALLLIGLALTACTTANQQYRYLSKPGVTAPGIQAALDQCRIASFKEIPQTMATDIKPGLNIPGTIDCHTYGSTTSCNQSGGVNIPATAQTYDVNGSLRERYMEKCMRNAGFTITMLPLCRTDEERAASHAASSKNQIPKCAMQTLDG
ncbi:hypothetical protein [Mesorhizobium sp. GbtcB19]|uniref:hypothetical protein n=1 Tax=Mesorhizobium sp. GbtcB19 TaxID=2824764 RepID=UPI001C2F240C|nr:hypothetical protein [Mesorhizobium sp. GbtcB19]